MDIKESGLILYQNSYVYIAAINKFKMCGFIIKEVANSVFIDFKINIKKK